MSPLVVSVPSYNCHTIYADDILICIVTSLETNVVFSLLNGEAFDYIGSSRMVYDLKQNNFNALGGINLKLDDIKSVIEFGQLGKGKVVLHSTNKDNTTKRLQNALNASILEDSVPPTSVQSFLQAKPNLTTVVITNHGKQFKNRFYNGILDDGENLSFNRYIYSSFMYLAFYVFFTIEIFMYHVLEMIAARLHQI